MKPLIIHVFTSSKGSFDEKTVFRVGESIQWNVAHTNTRVFERILRQELPSPIGQLIRVRYFIQHYGRIVTFSEGGGFELLFRHHEFWKHDTRFQMPVQFNWVSMDSIPDADDFVAEGDREEIWQQLELLWNPDSENVWLPSGFWKFQAFVEMTGADSGNLFNVSKETHFRVLKTSE